MKKRIIAAILSVCMILSLCACGKTAEKKVKVTPENTKLEEVFDRVFDAGTYSELDYDFAQKFFKKAYDKWESDEGMCTAVAKVTDDGTTMVGRNMDLTISNKAAYIMRTKAKGCYETVGLAYTFREIAPDYDAVKKDGITEEFRKVLPFLSDDVLNSEGLYIEVNMRNGETWPTGETKFGCSGTNPKSDERVYLFSLPRYLGEHCATVEEALKYVDKLNLYSMYGKDINAHTYCFMLADATGRYGLLEFGANGVYWNEGQQAQANFYINEKLAKDQTLKTGIGRYDKVMAGIDAVQTQEQMYELMDSVSYFQAYYPDKCQFDNRSEFVGFLPYWTYEYVMNELNHEKLEDVIGLVGQYLDTLTKEQMRNENTYWQSVFTEVVNCNEKTLFVRFYENDELTMTLGFDK